jgi:hypothetical protein
VVGFGERDVVEKVLHGAVSRAGAACLEGSKRAFTRVSLCRASSVARERLGPLETSWLFFEEVANL